MKKLFKASAWIMLTTEVIAMSLLGWLMLSNYSKPFYNFILISVIYLIPAIRELYCDRIYNKEERNCELAEAKEAYEQYVQAIKETLSLCGIDSDKKRRVLKAECESRLKGQAKLYNTLISKICSTLIGIPVGAIVSAIMYADRDAPTVQRMAGIIVIGAIAVSLSEIVKVLKLFLDGYYKDQYLLEILNELEYELA